MPAINYVVEADWDNDKKFNNQFSNLSNLWKEMTIVRGRESELENDMQVGTLEMRVLNQNRLFSPAWAAGDLHGKLLPRRRITVKTGIKMPYRTGLVMWLDANAISGRHDGDRLPTWWDISGNDYHLTQYNSSKQPIFYSNIVNGKPAVWFDGIDDHLEKTGLSIAQPYTVYVVWRIAADTGATQHCLEGAPTLLWYQPDGKVYMHAGAYLGYAKTIPFDSFIITSMFFNGVNSALYENAVLKAAGDAGALGITSIRLGNNAGETAPLKAYVAEILVWQGILDEPAQAAVASYLTQKWFTSSLDFTNLFSGYIDRIVPNPTRGEQDAYFYATDELSKLQGETDSLLLKDNLDSQIVANLAIYTAIPQYIIELGLDTYPYFWLQRQNVLETINHIAKSSTGLFYADPYGILRYETRAHRNTYHSTPQSTLTDTQFRLRYDYGNKELANQIIAKWHYRVKAVGLTTLWALTDKPDLQPGEVKIFWAIFDDPADDVVSPTAGDYTANSAQDGTGTDLTAYMSVSAEIYSQSAKLTITNTSSLPFYITLLKIRGKLIEEKSKGEAIAEDGASQGIYGVKSDSFDGTFINTAEQAQGRSDLLLSRKKDPVAEIGLVLRPESDAMVTAMLTREISDCVRISDALAGILTEDYHIEQIQHRIAPDMHETEWALTFHADAFDYWILGTSALGIDTRLA